MFKRIINYLKKLNTKQSGSSFNVNMNRKQNKAITRVSLLKDELKHITQAYDDAYNKLETSYNIKAFNYEEQYRKVQEIHLKHRKKLVSDKQLKQAEKELIPYKKEVTEAGYELDKVKEYQREDMLKIINEIEALKEEYIEELTNEISVASSEILVLKQSYLDKIISVGDSYKSIIDTENLMKKHLRETNGFTYNSNLKRILELKTGDLPLLTKDLVIERYEVLVAMKGT